MRINEEFIEDIKNDEIITPVDDEEVVVSYDAIIMFTVLWKKERVAKMIDKIMKSSLDLKIADVLPTEYIGNSGFMEIIAGDQRYRTMITGGNYYLPYGLKGNV